MLYKLLLLDIDGTLTASRGDALPSPAVIEAVQQAQKLLTVAVATGRPKAFAQEVLDALELQGYGIFNGGAEIINNLDDELVHRQLMSVVHAREVARLALPFGFKIYLEEDQYGEPLASPEDISTPTVKLFIEAVPSAAAMHLLEELNGVSGIIAHPTTSWVPGDVVDIHINHEHATKQHAAEQLMEILGCAKEEVIAVGDGYNDIPLLEAAGLKVAMGNAPAEVLAMADFIAPTLEEDGVAAVIERFILS